MVELRTGRSIINQFPKANTQSIMTQDCNLDPGLECGEDNVRTATANDELACYRLQLPSFHASASFLSRAARLSLPRNAPRCRFSPDQPSPG